MSAPVVSPDLWQRDDPLPPADPPFVKPFRLLGQEGTGLAFADGHLEVQIANNTFYLYASLVALLEQGAEVVGLQWV